ncbi:hypothetical protein KIPB_004266, partial [Kipferlia bialata]
GHVHLNLTPASVCMCEGGAWKLGGFCFQSTVAAKNDSAHLERFDVLAPHQQEREREAQKDERERQDKEDGIHERSEMLAATCLPIAPPMRYLAPECIVSQAAGISSDIYALTLMLLNLFSVEAPLRPPRRPGCEECPSDPQDVISAAQRGLGIGVPATGTLDSLSDYRSAIIQLHTRLARDTAPPALEGLAEVLSRMLGRDAAERPLASRLLLDETLINNTTRVVRVCASLPHVELEERRGRLREELPRLLAETEVDATTLRLSVLPNIRDSIADLRLNDVSLPVYCTCLRQLVERTEREREENPEPKAEAESDEEGEREGEGEKGKHGLWSEGDFIGEWVQPVVALAEGARPPLLQSVLKHALDILIMTGHEDTALACALLGVKGGLGGVAVETDALRALSMHVGQWSLDNLHKSILPAVLEYSLSDVSRLRNGLVCLSKISRVAEDRVVASHVTPAIGRIAALAVKTRPTALACLSLMRSLCKGEDVRTTALFVLPPLLTHFVYAEDVLQPRELEAVLETVADAMEALVDTRRTELDDQIHALVNKPQGQDSPASVTPAIQTPDGPALHQIHRPPTSVRKAPVSSTLQPTPARQSDRVAELPPPGSVSNPMADLDAILSMGTTSAPTTQSRPSAPSRPVSDVSVREARAPTPSVVPDTVEAPPATKTKGHAISMSTAFGDVTMTGDQAKQAARAALSAGRAGVAMGVSAANTHTHSHAPAQSDTNQLNDEFGDFMSAPSPTQQQPTTQDAFARIFDM